MSVPTSFPREAAFALVLSLTAGVLASTGGAVLGDNAAMRATVALLGLCIVLRETARSRSRAGKPSMVLLWLAVAALAWLLEPPAHVYVGLHVGLAWLARTVLWRRGAVAATLDLALATTALGVGAAALARTGSFGLACWSCLLVQSLQVWLPTAWPTGPHGRIGHAFAEPTTRFTRAQRTAEAALRRVASR